MFTQIYYVIRSKADGRYLVAHPDQDLKQDSSKSSYLLLFRESFDALSYLNTHSPDVAMRFATESVSQNQVAGLLQRWSYGGVGIVLDPLLPRITFLADCSGGF
ncbi:MAG TPA: hypothetical protein V6D03_15550 [Candidatus Caenarcaniphilales bacterium]